MSLGFVNPALLWGLAAASLPLLIHLFFRRRPHGPDLCENLTQAPFGWIMMRSIRTEPALFQRFSRARYPSRWVRLIGCSRSTASVLMDRAVIQQNGGCPGACCVRIRSRTLLRRLVGRGIRRFGDPAPTHPALVRAARPQPTGCEGDQRDSREPRHDRVRDFGGASWEPDLHEAGQQCQQHHRAGGRDLSEAGTAS